VAEGTTCALERVRDARAGCRRGCRVGGGMSIVDDEAPFRARRVKGEYCGCCISVEGSSWGSVKFLYR
jgi:hypothetical protein